MHRQIEVTLPEETLQLLEGVMPKGDRNAFINEAVKFYIAEKNKANLRDQLKEGAIRRAQRDLAIAEEWFDIEEEARQNSEK
ncbi:MAG: hypothetical protein F6J93_23895 [Oscillatoria sp. SIO1A7]|nr:hypothetical protein [Oscillatoria sp. SIO1A7]